MRYTIREKIVFLSVFLIFLVLIIPIQTNLEESAQTSESRIINELYPISSDSWSNFTYIHITDLNWSIAESYDWCQGNGSWVNPYIIENLTINASTSPTGSGIYIENSTNVYFIIRNITITNTGTTIYDGGIKLDNTNNGTLILNNCSNTERNGIILRNTCINNTIKLNELNFNQWFGIGGYGNFENLTIANNTFNNNQRLGIYTSAFKFVNIANNTFQDNDEGGFFTTNSYNNTFNNNYFYSNTQNGLHLGGNSNNNTVLNNRFEGNSDNGFYLYNANENYIINNSFSRNSDHGIFLESSSEQNTIQGNRIYDNNYDGIRIESNSDNNVIINNTIENIALNSQRYGIYLDTINDTTIGANMIRNNMFIGVYLYQNCYRNHIYNNSILNDGTSNQDDGIWIRSGSNDNIILIIPFKNLIQKFGIY